MRIGVVIVHYGSWERTTKCQQSFHDQKTQHQVESFIYNADIKNVGYGAGCNIGFDLFTDSPSFPNCDRVIFVNNDTTAGPGFIENIAKVDADFVCPKVLNYQGDVLYTGGRLTKTGPVHWLKNGTGKTEYLYGCCIKVKPGPFKRCGMFNEKYFMYFEDVELTLAAKAFGFTMAVAEDAILYHDRESKLDINPDTRYYAARNFPRAMGWTPHYFVYIFKRLVYFFMMGLYPALWATLQGFCHAITGRTGKR
jgi:GT2 family glycosyltransferase